MSWMSESDKSSAQLYALKNIDEQLNTLTKIIVNYIADDIKTKKESKFRRRLKKVVR